MSFLKTALPFMAAVAGANFLGTGSSGSGSSFKVKTEPKTKGVVSNFLGIEDTKVGTGVEKFIVGVKEYSTKAFLTGLQERGLGGGSSVTAQRIGGSKVGDSTPLSFKAGSVDLKLPGSSNERVLQKANAAMRSELFNQIVSASLKSSPRIGRTINLAQGNIKVKSRINPEIVKV